VHITPKRIAHPKLRIALPPDETAFDGAMRVPTKVQEVQTELIEPTEPVEPVEPIEPY
jgi:hypothetical protein